MTLAIGVMARAPLPGRCKTRLLGARSPEWVAALARAMLEDTLQRLDMLRAKRRLVLVAPLGAEVGTGAGAPAPLDARAAVASSVPAGWQIALQRGEGLGERLDDAMATLLDGGASRAMIVGSDCPHMPLAELAEIAELADVLDVLLGPTTDGGYYLIAARRREPRLFRGIAWSTPRVLGETLERCAELKLRAHLLPLSYDVDEPADLERLSADLALSPQLAPRTAVALRARSR